MKRVCLNGGQTGTCDRQVERYLGVGTYRHVRPLRFVSSTGDVGILDADLEKCMLSRKMATRIGEVKGTPVKWRDARFDGAYTGTVLTNIGCSCGAVPSVFVERTGDIQTQERRHEGDSCNTRRPPPPSWTLAPEGPISGSSRRACGGAAGGGVHAGLFPSRTGCSRKSS